MNSGKKHLQQQSPDFLKNVSIHSDVRDAICWIPDESVHLTFTSPPYYNVKEYSHYESYGIYLEFLREVFEQVHRITKEGRFLIVNTSPILIQRENRNQSSQRFPIPFDLHPLLIAQGWEFIDDIIWLKPERSVKSRIASFSQHRKPLSYKPNLVTEYLMVYRKKTDRLLDWNLGCYDLKTVANSLVADGFESSNVWKISPAFDKVHSAVFPAELCRRVIQYYSFQHDLVFDPFAGSGTLGKVAKSLQRHFLLTEQQQTYFDYMRVKIGDSPDCSFLSLQEFIEIAKFRTG